MRDMNVWQSLRRLIGRAETPSPSPVRRWSNPPVAIVQRGKSARAFLDEHTGPRRQARGLDRDAVGRSLLRQQARVTPRARNGA